MSHSTAEIIYLSENGFLVTSGQIKSPGRLFAVNRVASASCERRNAAPLIAGIGAAVALVLLGMAAHAYAVYYGPHLSVDALLEAQAIGPYGFVKWLGAAGLVALGIIAVLFASRSKYRVTVVVGGVRELLWQTPDAAFAKRLAKAANRAVTAT